MLFESMCLSPEFVTFLVWSVLGVLRPDYSVGKSEDGYFMRWNATTGPHLAKKQFLELLEFRNPTAIMMPEYMYPLFR